jgi:hypothetical protein
MPGHDQSNGLHTLMYGKNRSNQGGHCSDFKTVEEKRSTLYGTMPRGELLPSSTDSAKRR